ncbi:hypothetical protein, partial [Paenibacillus xylanexedens]|uniref:hypothetical protein n=1 Tax=Paenibacillus xylanexedens TaxID=528191 RepID=UPI001C92DCD8
MELLVFDRDDEIVRGNGGIVEENMKIGRWLECRFEDLLRLIDEGNIGLEGNWLDSFGRNGLGELVRWVLSAGIIER